MNNIMNTNPELMSRKYNQVGIQVSAGAPRLAAKSKIVFSSQTFFKTILWVPRTHPESIKLALRMVFEKFYDF